MTPRSQSAPAPLVVAASLAAVEGGVVLLFAVIEIASLSSERIALALSTTAFFVIYGLALVVCAGAVTRGHAWARSPLVLAQLIQLGVAWSFRGGDTTVVAIALAVVALVVIAGLLHPDSREALADEA